jgi:BlaI family transcriptional regulator, penicillinase repressor
MINAKQARPRNLSGVEQLVMDYVWAAGPASAEAVRESVARQHAMKDSTVRTVLRRLEAKGYLRHKVAGRTFLYRATHGRQNIAARAVRNIVERFCGGSVEQLLVGMVENEVLKPEELERLARKIAQAKEAKP